MRTTVKLMMIGAAMALATAAAAAPARRALPAAEPTALAPLLVAQRGLSHAPDVRQFYICRVLPHYGGDFCTAPPYAPIGKACSCEGPKGPRPGVVERR